MQNNLSRILSYLFHPLLLPTYSYLIMMFQGELITYIIPLKMKGYIIIFVFLISAALPVLINYVFLKKGLIHSLELASRQERLLPFLFTAVCFYLTAVMAKKLQLPGVFYLFSLGSSLLALLALFLTFYMKVSIHMMGIGGMTGTFLALSMRADLHLLYLIMALFLISGLLAYARLYLKAHKSSEVYSGFTTGFGVMLLLFLLI